MLTCKHNRVALLQTPLGLYPSELRWMYLKGVLRNFANFTLKTPVSESQVCKFIKKRLQHRCFPVKFAKTFKDTLFYRTPSVAASLNFETIFLTLKLLPVETLKDTILKLK